MNHVVAVAHEYDRQILHAAAQLAQGQAIGQHLAGMVEVAQPVDDRNLRAGRELHHRLMQESPGHDDVHPQRQVLADIGDRFAAP